MTCTNSLLFAQHQLFLKVWWHIADSTTVRVSWEEVTNADRYTVTFTRATEEQQEGLCSSSSHTANLTVDAPTTTANIDIGENVLSSDSHMLRAYSTYFIIVQAENNGGSSEGSEQESILTPQIGMIHNA